MTTKTPEQGPRLLPNVCGNRLRGVLAVQPGSRTRWKIGSSVTFRRNGELVVSGKVLECDPPRRLSYTFHSQHDGLYTEQPSRVVFDLEQQRDQVKLTMTHDDFAPDSKVFDKISNGWPLVLSSLKSYLEMNRVVLHAPWYDKEPASVS